MRYSLRFTAFLLVAAGLLVLPCGTRVAPCETTYKRVVILSPAAADVFERLGAEEIVVGVTKSVKAFPQARRVGSHIRPNLEIIASLHPDLIVLSSNRFFSMEMAKKIGAQVFYYNPATCKEILDTILKMGSMVGKTPQAESLVHKLRGLLKRLRPVSRPPTVLYEVMEHPYLVAGKRNIVADMVRLAGGRYLVDMDRKLVRFSCEKAVALGPQVYIYQVGPMNKNPVPPQRRPYFKNLKTRFVKVSELTFARPNTRTFENLLWLNRLFLSLQRYGGVE